MWIRLLILTACAAAFAVAQQLTLPEALENQLRQKAEEVTEVDLDSTMLGLARQVLSSKDPDQAKAKQVIDRLKGVYVRVYEFKEDNAYSLSQLEPLRTQFAQSSWKKMVNVRKPKSGELVEVFVKMENNRPAGLAVIAAEPRELAIVHLDGPINLEDLGELGGQFGIPNMGGVQGPDPAKPKEER